MDRAFDLALAELRVDRAPHVVRRDELRHAAGLVHDGDLRREAEGRMELQGLAGWRRLAEMHGVVRKGLAHIDRPGEARERPAGVEIGPELLRRIHDGAPAEIRRARPRRLTDLHRKARVDARVEDRRWQAGDFHGALDEDGEEPLPHLREAVVERDAAAVFHDEASAPVFFRAVADPAVLDAAGDARAAAVLLPDVLHREERLLEADRRVELLAARPRVARLERIPPADLPAVEAGLLGEHVERALDREVSLVRSEAAHRAARRVVRVHGERLDVDVLAPVRPRRMPGCALEDLASDRRVRARVADHPGLHGREAPFRVAADPVAHRDRMPLRVEAHGLLARENEPDGPPRDAREERRLGLDRHVLLASEGAAVRDEDDVDVLDVEPEKRGHLPPVVEDALPLREERQLRLRVLGRDVARRRETGLGLEVEVLDALRPPRALDDVRRGGERRVRVAEPDDGARKEVAVRSDRRCALAESLLRVRDGRQDLVRDLHERRRGAGRARIHRGDGREDVAHVVRLLALGDESRPVRDDEAIEALPGHVARRHDGHDPGVPCRDRRVDRLHAGARVRRERHGAVEHPGKREVGDVRTHPERELRGLVAREARPDAPRLVLRRQRLAAPQACRDVERVDDLDVARAPAEVRVELLRDLVVRRVGVRVEDALHPERDARDAEAALDARRARERLAVDVALRLGHALEREDALSRGGPGRHGARRLRMAIHEHEARAALALRRAAVLRRRESRVIAHELEERRAVRDVEGPGHTIERQLDVHGRLSTGRAMTSG